MFSFQKREIQKLVIRVAENFPTFWFRKEVNFQWMNINKKVYE